MNYPAFGRCPYCGEWMAFSMHASAWLAGLAAGIVTFVILLAATAK